MRKKSGGRNELYHSLNFQDHLSGGATHLEGDAVDLPRGHRVTALPRRYLTCLLFLGMFAPMVAHITGLRERASAFPAMVPRWLVNYGEISLLVARLFLINLNIYTESRLLSKAEFVACVRSCVVPGMVAAELGPCLPRITACPATAGDSSRRVTLGRGTDTRRRVSANARFFQGVGCMLFFPRSYFLMPILAAVFGKADDSRQRGGGCCIMVKCHIATPIVKVT